MHGANHSDQIYSYVTQQHQQRCRSWYIDKGQRETDPTQEDFINLSRDEFFYYLLSGGSTPILEGFQRKHCIGNKADQTTKSQGQSCLYA